MFVSPLLLWLLSLNLAPVVPFSKPFLSEQKRGKDMSRFESNLFWMHPEACWMSLFSRTYIEEADGISMRQIGPCLVFPLPGKSFLIHLFPVSLLGDSMSCLGNSVGFNTDFWMLIRKGKPCSKYIRLLSRLLLEALKTYIGWLPSKAYHLSKLGSWR